MGTRRRFDWIHDDAIMDQLCEVEHLITSRVDASSVFHAQLRSSRSKRLRPALLLLCANACGAPLDDRVRFAAAALELVHEGSLYHDDIVDQAILRRGEPTASARFGARAAATVGSALFYDGVAMCRDLPDTLREEVARVARRACRGQVREIELTGVTTVGMRERVKIMIDKTASLFGLAATMGAVLAGASVRERRALERFAVRLGLCFQLADDLNDLTADAETLGRPPGIDLRDGIYTIPTLFALESGAPGRANLLPLLADLFHGTREGVLDVARLQIQELGGVSRSAALLKTWRESARRALDHGPGSKHGAARGSLLALLDRFGVPTSLSTRATSPVRTASVPPLHRGRAA